MIIALAGRRISLGGSRPASFPVRNVPLVRRRLRALFERHGVRVLVSSAACGADLIAQQVAARLNMRRVVILPWDAERFAATSVNDCGQRWNRAYWRVLRAIQPDDVRVIRTRQTGSQAYMAVNMAILRAAQSLADADGDAALATVVWDGRSRGSSDMTASFAATAQRRRMPVIAVATV